MLSNRALLVYLSISQWTGRKLDRRAGSAVEGKFTTQKGVGNYHKKLLPNSKHLAAIHTKAGQIRNYFYDQTLPWLSDGARILSSQNYLEFVRKFNKMKSDYNRIVEEFLAEYPRLKVEAKVKLGELYDEFEYPSESRLRHAFECEINIMPMPEVGDFRTEVLESEKQEFLKKMAQIENNATKECFERLQEVVDKASKTLAKPNAIFRDSLIKNISSICELLPKINITDDANLEKARQEVETIASTISPAICREDNEQRQIAAKKLAEIADRMGAFMGAR